MKKLVLTFASALLVGSIALTSCDKQKEAIFDQSAVDNATADAQFNDLDNITTEAMISQESQLGVREVSGERTSNFRGCGTYTFNTSTKTMTIDFGTGVTCNDGKTRKGKLIITYTGRYMTPGSVITTTTDNYYVNNVKVEGRKTVTNVTQQGGNPKHTVVVADGKLTYADGSTFTWTTNRTREWLSGSGDLNFTNDVWSITGDASGVNRKGKSFVANITNPIIIKAECFATSGRMPVQGTYSVVAENASKTVDFGTGACDRTITVTITNVGQFTIGIGD
jgi:hypothetical protein